MTGASAKIRHSIAECRTPECILMTYLCSMLRFFALLLMFSCILPVMHAQNAGNPFELVFRLPKTAANPETGQQNPFDMAPHRAPGISLALAVNETERFNPFAILPRGGGFSNSALLTCLMLMLGFLTVSVATNRSAVGKAWRGFLNDNALNLAQREAFGIVGSTPYYLLYANFLLNAALFIFLVTHTLQDGNFYNLRFLVVCLGVAGVGFLFKHVMVNLTSYLFHIDQEARRYNFLIVIFNCVLGLFLVPFNLLIAFTGNSEYKIFLVFWMLGLVTIFYLYRTFRSAGLSSKFLIGSPFHFLLYLCTVEIAPVLFLVKLAMMQKT